MAPTNLQYVRFYPESWAASGTVQDMNMEEVGVYWTLLVVQMVDGFVPADPKKLIRRLNAKDEEDAKRLLSPKVMEKFHPDPNDPSKLYNHKLSEVTTLTKSAKENGEYSAYRRWNPDPMPEVGEVDGEKIDLSSHLKRMPRRKVKGKFDKAGWERGVAMLKYVTSKEEADRLYAAIDAYARERNGEDAEYHISFGNFMKEWESYVPSDYDAKKIGKPEKLATEPAAAGAKVLPISSAPKWRLGDTPPWVIGPYDTESMKKSKTEDWADKAKRERWLEARNYPKEWADVDYQATKNSVKEQNQ